MDTVSYPQPAVIEYLQANFVLHKASMEMKESRQLFRAHQIVWTPSIGFADRNGSMHYKSQGFFPPSELLSALRIGRARCVMAWTRSAEAIRELETAASEENAMTPEVLFWLSVSCWLERRDTTRMYSIWEQMAARYPQSPWTMRTYPRPE